MADEALQVKIDADSAALAQVLTETAFAVIPGVDRVETYTHIGSALALRIYFTNGYVLSVVPEYDILALRPEGGIPTGFPGMVMIPGECEIALLHEDGFADSVPGFEHEVQRHLSIPAAAAEARRCAALPPYRKEVAS